MGVYLQRPYMVHKHKLGSEKYSASWNKDSVKIRMNTKYFILIWILYTQTIKACDYVLPFANLNPVVEWWKGTEMKKEEGYKFLPMSFPLNSIPQLTYISIRTWRMSVVHMGACVRDFFAVNRANFRCGHVIVLTY